jgi:Bacterial Ig-like domain (group 3)
MSHQHGRISRLLRLLAAALGVTAISAATAWAATTFTVSSTKVTPRAVINVHSVTPCPPPAEAGDWIAIVRFGQGSNPALRRQDYVVASNGTWSGTFTIPSAAQAGSAQLTASCFDTAHTSSDVVTYSPIAIHVVLPTTTTIICRPLNVRLGQATKCTATVSNNSSTGESPPSGKVTFTASGRGRFNRPVCRLKSVSASRSRCQVSYTPTKIGPHHITVVYPGDDIHAGGSSFVNVHVTR